MKIPDQYMSLLLDEFTVIESKMAEVKTPGEQLYFLSAAHGALNRVMNFHCDPVLVLVHQVLFMLHQNIQGRIAAQNTPDNRFLVTPPEFFTAAREIIAEVRRALQSDSQAEIFHVMVRAANLGYAATGNGFYLFIQGKLKI